MKNPQNYKKFYEQLHVLRNGVCVAIQSKLEEFESRSVDLSYAESHVSFGFVNNDEEEYIGIGISMDENKKVTVYYSHWDMIHDSDITDLDTHTLLRLYKVFEEAVYEHEPLPFEF